MLVALGCTTGQCHLSDANHTHTKTRQDPVWPTPKAKAAYAHALLWLYLHCPTSYVIHSHDAHRSPPFTLVLVEADDSIKKYRVRQSFLFSHILPYIYTPLYFHLSLQPYCSNILLFVLNQFQCSSSYVICKHDDHHARMFLSVDVGAHDSTYTYSVRICFLL